MSHLSAPAGPGFYVAHMVFHAGDGGARVNPLSHAPVVTTIGRGHPFYEAEAYHHDYAAQNPSQARNKRQRGWRCT